MFEISRLTGGTQTSQFVGILEQLLVDCTNFVSFDISVVHSVHSGAYSLGLASLETVSMGLIQVIFPRRDTCYFETFRALSSF